MVSSKRRILALWLPRLSTDRIRRGKNCAVGLKAPLAIAQKRDNALVLSAVDENASRLSLRVGQPLANVRAMVPELAVFEADPALDRKLLESIAQWSDRFTPFVALDCPDGLLLDITGASHLFGGEKNMLTHVRENLKKQKFSVCVALAGTAAAARALARYVDGAIVPEGGEALAVAPLPVAALSLDPLIAHALRRAGLKTIGQVAGRGRAELAQRFGSRMVDQLDRVLGRSETPISPRRPVADLMAEHRFAEPIITKDAIMASLLSLAQSLSRALEERGEGARRLEAVFFRSDGTVSAVSVETAQPLRDARMITRLLDERLDALADPLDPGFGFDLIRLEVLYAEHERKAAQTFASGDAEKEIAFLIDRLSARFGKTRVLSFQPNDTHIPEAAVVLLPAQEAKATGWKKDGIEAMPRPLRLFAAPEPIEVTAEVPDGPPRQFRWRRALHGVVRAEGPERIAMEWWRKAGFTRDYFHVEDETGRRFWLYRDGLYVRETERPRWYVHGLFA